VKKSILLEPHAAAPDGLDSDALARIEALAGERMVSARRVTAGYNATERWLARFASGRGVFAKIGTPPRSDQHLRDEHALYARLALTCMPAVLGWEDHPKRPILLLEDLSSWTWPPPWTRMGVAAALRAIEEIHAARAGLDPYGVKHGDAGADGWWASLERDPEPFLGLGVVTREWWRRAGPVLREAASHVSPEGECVCHFDLRSDNLCLWEGRAMVVDWSHGCLGNRRVDLGLFLPGVAAEGGPSPGELLPNAPEVAAWVAGFFAHYASKPPVPGAPRVREMQRVHLAAALAWASDELGL